MCIRAYLNGDGMGYKTHLSLFFVLMKGEFDALLKWPFEHKISMILVGKVISLQYNLINFSDLTQSFPFTGETQTSLHCAIYNYGL